MIDLDGSFEYSKVIFVKTDCENDNAINIYPNPMIGEINQLNIDFQPKNAVTQMTIIDMTGRIVRRTTIDTSIGENTNVQINVSHLPSGTYNLMISGERKSNIFVISE